MTSRTITENPLHQVSLSFWFFTFSFPLTSNVLTCLKSEKFTQHLRLTFMPSPQHLIYNGFTIFPSSDRGGEENLFKACIFQDLYTLFLRSYSRLQHIPPTYKMLANIALVGDLRLYTGPQLEWDHTQQTY